MKYDYMQSVFTPPTPLVFIPVFPPQSIIASSFSLPPHFLHFPDPLSPIIAAHVCMNVWLATGTLEINPDSVRL